MLLTVETDSSELMQISEYSQYPTFCCCYLQDIMTASRAE